MIDLKMILVIVVITAVNGFILVIWATILYFKSRKSMDYYRDRASETQQELWEMQSKWSNIDDKVKQLEKRISKLK